MTYLEWNNQIGHRLFHENMAGKEVYLFLTRSDIIKIGKASGYFERQEDSTIWNDFIASTNSGFSSKPANTDFLGKLEHAFERRNLSKIHEPVSGKDITIFYPPYLAYLVLTVLPVLENANPQAGDTLRANNYYQRIRSFLEDNHLPSLPNMTLSRNWNHIWQHLEKWSVNIKKTDLGIFRVRNFSGHWVYVGIPLSQCLIDPKALKLLPKIFLEEDLIPNCAIPDKKWRAFLEKTWVKELKQRPEILEHISRDEDEMGKVVLEIVKQAYGVWQGEPEAEEETSPLSPASRVRKIGFRARLFLTFKVDKNTSDLKWGCRMFSSNDYPEDLSFDGLRCHEARENWSNQLETGFLEKARLKDSANKWEAELPEKDLRFFIGGATLNLNSEFWVETDQMNRISLMRLLCKNDRKKSVEDWGKHFQPPAKFKKFDNDDLGNIPEGWHLFEFQYPKIGIEGVPAAQLLTTKKIMLVGGAKKGQRTYLKTCLPEVFIENCDGSETGFLETVSHCGKIPLRRKSNDSAFWQLPESLPSGDEFVVVFNDQTLTFKIADENILALKLDNSACPRRNRFGTVAKNEADGFVQGSLVNDFDYTRQHVYIHHFQPAQDFIGSAEPRLSNNFNPENDQLLEFLTRRKNLLSGEFFEAFEQILSRKIFGEMDGTATNLTLLKRQVLNLYDFLGYVDFDYTSKRIVTNPPQMFLIPTRSGRKAFLTGARTPDFVINAFEKAAKLGLQISSVTQAGANNPVVLLPDTLIVEAHDLPAYGMEELKSFAHDLKIYFDPEHIAQWGLLNFSAGIDEYEQSLLTDDRFEDYDWSRKIFNPDTFRFERAGDGNFDKTFSLLEYQFNAYTYRHILWKNGAAFPVDKSWGRWLVLKHHKKQVVFHDQNGTTAIPTGMPLPRLISEAFLLCSGRVPEQKTLEVEGIKTVFSLFGNVVKIMLHNEFSRIGQTPISVNQIF